MREGENNINNEHGKKRVAAAKMAEK